MNCTVVDRRSIWSTTRVGFPVDLSQKIATTTTSGLGWNGHRPFHPTAWKPTMIRFLVLILPVLSLTAAPVLADSDVRTAIRM